jgi:hypothetical protein
VTAFEARLHQVGPRVFGGLSFHPAGRSFSEERTVFTVMRRAPAASFVPAELHGRPAIARRWTRRPGGGGAHALSP